MAFRLTNLGTEYHEMGILRRLDSATQSWEEIAPGLMTEEESAMQQVEWVGHAWSPNGDTTGFAFVNLEPGEYAAICFIPIGSKQDMPEDEVFAAAEGDYDAHWQHGMLQEFTVVDAGGPPTSTA